MKKLFTSDGYCVNKYVLFSAGFIGFYTLPARQPIDSVFYVPQNALQNPIAFRFVKRYCEVILSENKFTRGRFLKQNLV